MDKTPTRRISDEYRILIDAISEYAICMIDTDGLVATWNKGAERVYGYAADEIIGQPFAHFFSPEKRAENAPQAALDEAARLGRHEIEGWLLRKDGSRFAAITVLEPIRDASGALIGYAQVMRDNTERRQAEEVLHESEQQFRRLVASVTDYAIFMLDPDGIVTNWNAGARRIKGYTADEIVGQHFSRFYPEADRANGKPARALSKAMEEGRYEAEGWRVRKDGTQFWASVVIDAIRDENGKLLGFAKITRDISEKRAAQLAMQKLQDQLAHAQKMEAMGRLTGGIAHDFNNILAIVSGHAEILGRRLADPKDRRSVEAIDKAARRGETLTRQLLSFSRRQRLQTTVVDLKSHFDGIGDMLRGSISSSVQVTIALPPDLWRIETDLGMLDLALLNLFMNSRDAMPNGGTITIGAENVVLRRGEVAGDLEGEFVALAVADSGTGIPDDVMPNIFDPFFTTKNPQKGTGLGLSQVYGFVHQSGGGIAVTSHLGHGTTITLYLPRGNAETHEATRRTVEPFTTRSATILVVDDNPEVANVTTTLLEELGYDVRIANSADMALSDMRSGAACDLVFSDIVMPGNSGIELALTLRSLYPSLPIILTTGYSDPVHEAEIPPEFPILRKPFKQAELGRVIALALAAAEAEEERQPLLRFATLRPEIGD